MSNLPKNQDNLIFFILATFVGLLLKLSYIGRDFWHDESFQVLFSKMPSSIILHSNDVHPPLFTFITKYIVWFTTNPLFLRMVMVIISLMFAFIFYDTIKGWFGSKVALYSYILLNMSPTFAYYSTEFRSYIFVMFLTIIQIKYFNKMLKKKNPFYGLSYVFLSTAMIYSHYMAGLIIFTQLIYLNVNNKLSKYFVEYLLMFIYSLPVVFYLVQTLPKIQSFWFKEINLISYISSFFYIITFPEYVMFQIITIIILSFVIYAIIIQYMMKKEKRLFIQLLMYVFLPVTTMWVISQFFQFFHPRYFLFGGIMLFPIAGIGIAHWNKNNKFWKSAIIIGMLLFPLLFPYHFTTPIKDSAMSIKDKTGICIHTSPFSMSPYKIYLPNFKHFLITNLTKKMRFTAGGSVILDSEIIKKSKSGFKMPTSTYYLVTDIETKGGEKIYDKEGLKVTRYY